jgi:putative transposase
VDFWVRYKDRQIRPWLTAIQDCGSRRIVGWTFGPAPHQESILVALRMAFREAVPEVMRIDNGKDFASKTVTGLTKTECRVLRREYGPAWKTVVRRGRDHVSCDDPRWLGVTGELGVELIYAKPYSPWSKGTLERWFRTFEDQCGKLFNTYCGHTPVARPESLQLIREGYTGRGVDPLSLVDGSAVPTMDQAAERISDYLTIYHSASHQGAGMRGRSPQAAWSDAAHLRKAVEGELDCLISVRGAYKVGANGVHLTVCGTHLGYGARTAALRAWIGREVLVAVDIEYPARCLAFEPGNRRLIAALNPNKRIHPLAKSDDLREANAAVGHNRKDMVGYAKKSARRTLDVSKVLERERSEQAVALRATGTDDMRATAVSAVIRPVRSGFEARSTAVPPPVEAVPDEYADLDMSLVSFVQAEESGDGGDPYADVDLADLKCVATEEGDGPYGT